MKINGPLGYISSKTNKRIHFPRLLYTRSVLSTQTWKGAFVLEKFYVHGFIENWAFEKIGQEYLSQMSSSNKY